MLIKSPETNMAVYPHWWHIYNPITGPTDIPSVVDNAKYPIPSPLLEAGILSIAIVDPDTVVNPQVSPCPNRRNIMDVMVNATKYPANSNV
jgi:hypothetical protein